MATIVATANITDVTSTWEHSGRDARPESSPDRDLLQRLRSLVQLRDLGWLTPEELEAQKNEILGEIMQHDRLALGSR